MTNKMTCLVCGRKFPRGQGVIFVLEEKEYAFHSKRCALRFLKRVLEELDKSLIKPVFDRVSKEFEEELKITREKKAKKIA